MKLFNKVIILVLILLAAYICFFKLGHSYFENWDEGFYAQVTKEMLQTKDPIILHWNKKIFLDKTPLNFWLNALSAKIFGLSEFSIRLTSALSGFIIILIITIITYQWWGIVPSLFAFSAITLNNLFIWRTRTGNLDTLLSLLILLVYLLIIGKSKYRYILLGIIFGLIYLQKSNIVFFPMTVFFLFELLTNIRKIKKNFTQYILLILCFLLVGGSWILAGWLRLGRGFTDYYLFRVDQGVTDLKLSFFNTDYLNYTYYSLQRRLIYPFILGLILLSINIKKSKNLVLLIFSTFLIVVLSFTEKKNNWYLVPAMPFWAITITYGVSRILNFAKKQNVELLISIIILVPLVYISLKTFSININSVINMEASVNEVKSAKMIKKISKPDEVILRLDHAYPVTLFYSDRKTHFYVTIDPSLYSSIKYNHVKYLVGNKQMIEGFVKDNRLFNYEIIDLGHEEIVKILGLK